jgi:ribosome-associated protein
VDCAKGSRFRSFIRSKASLLSTELSAPIPEVDPNLPEPTGEALTQLILTKLDDDKAEDILAIDLKGSSPLADTIVIASGRSQRHVSALADHLLRALKDAGYGRAQVEGLPHADWVLIDAGDVIVHLFRPEVRSFYQIEKIWSVDSPHRGLSAN